MKEAIEKAIEGGYDKEGLNYLPEVNFLDIDFWKCLGKALNWKNLQWKKMYGDFVPGYQTKRWHYEWHRFIDHLAEGKDPEVFFKNLLS